MNFLNICAFTTLMFPSSHNSQYGTGFIGKLPLDGKDSIVLVTVSHVIPTMEVALSSQFTFQYVKDNEGTSVNGTVLFAGCENSHKVHPPHLVR